MTTDKDVATPPAVEFFLSRVCGEIKAGWMEINGGGFPITSDDLDELERAIKQARERFHPDASRPAQTAADSRRKSR